MKKTLLVAAVACMAMVSCKKDYTCECTTSGNGTSISASTTIKDTKSKAKDACEKGTTAEVAGYKTTCVIK